MSSWPGEGGVCIRVCGKNRPIWWLERLNSNVRQRKNKGQRAENNVLEEGGPVATRFTKLAKSVPAVGFSSPAAAKKSVE